MCRRDVPLKSTFCVQKMFFFENLKKKAHNRKKGCLKHSQKRFERFSNTGAFALNSTLTDAQIQRISNLRTLHWRRYFFLLLRILVGRMVFKQKLTVKDFLL